MAVDGSLAAAEWPAAAAHLQQLCCGYAWRWLPGARPEQGVLVLDAAQPRMPQWEAEADDETAVVCADRAGVASSLQLCIFYHGTYRTPALLLRPDEAAGVGLVSLTTVLEQLQMRLSACASDIFTPAAWPYDSPHPQLSGTPWLCLHPCQTAEAMRVLLSSAAGDERVESTRSYMRAWWSLAGGVIGLSLPVHARCAVAAQEGL